MQTPQQKIISYLSDISHGVVNISEQNANAIMFFAGVTGGEYVSTAIKYRLSALRKGYEMERTINTSDERINKLASSSFYNDQEGRSYKYECLKSNGEKVILYSNQCSLFD